MHSHSPVIWNLLQGGNPRVPSRGPSASFTANRPLGVGKTWVRGLNELGDLWHAIAPLWTSLSHTQFYKLPQVLPVSGQFSQRPRRLWARLCAGRWRAGQTQSWSQPEMFPASLPAHCFTGLVSSEAWKETEAQRDGPAVLRWPSLTKDHPRRPSP